MRVGYDSTERLSHSEWLHRLIQEDACIVNNETLRQLNEQAREGVSAEKMDDFIRAVLAGNMPRNDEPYATVATFIRALMNKLQAGA